MLVCACTFGVITVFLPRKRDWSPGASQNESNVLVATTPQLRNKQHRYEYLGGSEKAAVISIVALVTHIAERTFVTSSLWQPFFESEFPTFNVVIIGNHWNAVFDAFKSECPGSSYEFSVSGSSCVMCWPRHPGVCAMWRHDAGWLKIAVPCGATWGILDPKSTDLSKSIGHVWRVVEEVHTLARPSCRDVSKLM